ncbi:MAG: hypothetical protein V4696_06880 [Pseudomonadota bacterium]
MTDIDLGPVSISIGEITVRLGLGIGITQPGAGGGAPALPAFATDYNTGYVYGGGVSNSPNFASGPTGSTAADKTIEDGSGGGHSAYLDIARSAGSNTVVFYLKAAERGFGFVQIGADSAANRYGVVVNLSTGAVTASSTVGTTTGNASSVLDAGGGWWRIAVTTNHGGGTLFAIYGLSNVAVPSFNGVGYPDYSGDTVSGILVAR